jgi:hypothetical protein
MKAKLDALYAAIVQQVEHTLLPVQKEWVAKLPLQRYVGAAQKGDRDG